MIGGDEWMDDGWMGRWMMDEWIKTPLMTYVT